MKMRKSAFDTSGLGSPRALASLAAPDAHQWAPEKDPLGMFSASAEAIKAENEKLRGEISEYRAQLKQVTESAERNYSQARKYRKKCGALSSELEATLGQVSALAVERDKLARDSVVAVEDVKLLKLQLEAAHATHLEAQTAWNAMQMKTKHLENTIETLNEQLENQRAEIAELTEARAKCLNLIEIMHRALCQSESRMADLIVESQKQRAVEMKRIEPELRLPECVLPFKGELRERVAAIWKDEQVGAKQRIEAGLNEVCRVIEDLQRQVDARPSVDEKEVARLENENQKYRDVLEPLLGSLKQLAATEETAANAAFYTMDASLCQFLARNCFDHAGDCVRNRFSSYGILGEENQYHRIGLVKEISALGMQEDAFISGLLIVNNYLSKEVRKLMDCVAQKAEMEEAMQVISASNPAEFSERITDIRNEIVKLVEYKKKLKVVAHQLQDELNSKESELANANGRISDLETENEHLQSELQVFSNKALLNSSTTTTTSRSTSSIVDQRTSALEGKIQMLESRLVEKEKELYNFKELHLKTSRQAELTVHELTQKAQALTVKLETIQEAYQQLKMRDLSSKDRYKKKVHTLTKQHMRELSEQRAKLEDAQQMLNTTSTGLQERINQTNTLSKKLADSLAESERRNQALNEEVSNLTASKHKLEARLRALEDRNDKEKQMYQVQATARILAAETRLHESSTKEKTSLLKEINQLTGYIADELGTFYGLSGANLDTETCRQLLIRAKADLSKAANS